MCGTDSVPKMTRMASTRIISTRVWPRSRKKASRGAGAASPPPRIDLLVGSGLGRVAATDGEVGLQAGEVLLADALHVHQLLRGLERAGLLPVLDDARRELRPHAGQLGQLLGGGGVDVHLARRG